MIINNKNEITYSYDGRTGIGYDNKTSVFFIDDENREFRFQFDIDVERDERLFEYIQEYNGWEYTIDELIKMKQADWSNVPRVDDSFITTITELIDEYLIFNESEVK